jgi:hypothetical protein
MRASMLSKLRSLPPLPFVLLALALAAQAFAPQVPQPPAQRGLAQLDWSHNEDRATIGVTQFYAWGMNSCGGDYDHCTPMNRNWDLAAQTFCPPRELLGNEPTNPEPAGHPISASVAASVTVAIEAACPGMRIIAANIHLNNCCGYGPQAYTWLRDYLAAYQLRAGHTFTQTLGVHCYSQWADDCLARLTELQTVPYDGVYWLTEFAMFGAAPYTSGDELARFLRYAPLQAPIERYYIWTNRDGGSVLDLVNSAGALTAMGTVYKNWTPPSVMTTWLPDVAKHYLPPTGYP